jgi:hypothetical protein
VLWIDTTALASFCPTSGYDVIVFSRRVSRGLLPLARQGYRI